MTAKERSFAAYSEAGLHPYHHAILAVLDEGSLATQGAIADTLGYDKGQLVGLLDELENAGLIERRRDPTDRRRQLVRMTASGRKTLERLRRLSGRLESEFLAALSDEERAQLHTLLAAARRAAPAQLRAQLRSARTSALRAVPLNSAVSKSASGTSTSPLRGW